MVRYVNLKSEIAVQKDDFKQPNQHLKIFGLFVEHGMARKLLKISYGYCISSYGWIFAALIMKIFLSLFPGLDDDTVSAKRTARRQNTYQLPANESSPVFGHRRRRHSDPLVQLGTGRQRDLLMYPMPFNRKSETYSSALKAP